MGERMSARAVVLSPAFPLVERTHQGVWSIPFRLCLALDFHCDSECWCVCGSCGYKASKLFHLVPSPSHSLSAALIVHGLVCSWIAKLLLLSSKKKMISFCVLDTGGSQNSNKHRYVSFALNVLVQNIPWYVDMRCGQNRTKAFALIFLMIVFCANFYFFLVDGWFGHCLHASFCQSWARTLTWLFWW